MSHQLHREGSREGLSHDFTMIFTCAQGYNTKDSGAKMVRFLEIAKRHNPVNYAGMATGVPEDIKGNHLRWKSEEETLSKIAAGDNGVAHAVFTDPADVAAVLEELKREDMGQNVVVSGLFDVVADCCHKAGLEPHTVNMSLGVFGKTENRPKEPEVNEIITMCGHGMVPANDIYWVIEQIKKGFLTPEKAANELCRLCICGIFNPDRCAKILRGLAGLPEA